MQLVEFMAYWPGDYSEEDAQTYSVLYGDDRANWPPTHTYSPIVIDVDRVIRFNPALSKENTTVDLAGGVPITINMSYEDFKDILSYFSIQIHSTVKNAL